MIRNNNFNPKRFRKGNLRLHLVPILVWLSALAGVIAIFAHKTQSFEVRGLVQGQKYRISPTCTGRIEDVKVELFDKIKKGQVVAVLNRVPEDMNIQGQINTIAAEVQHLMAQLVPTQEQLLTEQSEREVEKAAELRNFNRDIEQARLEILELKTSIATDRVTLQDLEMELQIAKDLFEKQAIAKYELQKAQAAYNITNEKIKETKQQLFQAQQILEKSQQRRLQFLEKQQINPSIDSALEVIHKDIRVQEEMMAELLELQKPLELTSPADGIVSEIHSSVGDVIRAGDDILTITADKADNILAYATQQQVDQINNGDKKVQLRTNGMPIKIAESKIVNIGPIVQDVNEIRLRTSPDRQQWGRPVIIEAPANLQLVPGEIVSIKGF